MDLKLQIAMTAIKDKKFYQERQDQQEAGKGQNFKPVQIEKEALMTIDEGQINWVEQTTDEELNHALMAFTMNMWESNEDNNDIPLILQDSILNAWQGKLLLEQKGGSCWMLGKLTPVWTNTNRVDLSNINSPPQTYTISKIRPNFSTASRLLKMVGSMLILAKAKMLVMVVFVHVSSGTHIKSGASRFNTGKQHVNSGSVHVNSGRVNRPVSNNTSPKPSQVNLQSPKKCFSKQRSPVNRPFSRNTAHKSNHYAVKGKMGTAVKTSAGCVWRKVIPLSNTNSGPTPESNVDHPLKHMEHRGIFDSGCSGHMTGNRAHLEDYLNFPSGICYFWREVKFVSVEKRRLGHLNFKNLNKLVKGNLVRGLPSKSFKNDHTCVACQKGKQHKASCKAKIDRYVTHPLHTLHMDLFGPTSVRSINHASYCLVITDDCSRFCWVFFLAKKDETSDILKTFIRQIENQLNQKVKIIRSDNGTEFKNRVMLEFCGEKGIKQEFSNARTPQQNGVAERMNRTLIEAARTMLADSHLPTTFWAEAVNTACYTFNRVRVTKPQNKTPYELLFGHKPILSYIRPFGCHVTILNTLSPLGKFDGKSDEGFLVGYSVNSKAFRVYNLVTKRVEVNLHVNFLEEKPNVQGIGHRWMFDLDFLTDSMNYIPVSLQNQANPAGSKEVIDIDVQNEEAADLMVVSSTSLTEATRNAAVSEKIAKKKTHSSKQPSSTPISKSADDIMIFRKELDALALKHLGPVPATAPTSTNPVNTGSDNLNTGFEEDTPGNIEAISPKFPQCSPQSQILWRTKTPVQTRSSLKKITEAHALFEPRKVTEALEDGSWVEAMQEEHLQFKLQQVIGFLVIYPKVLSAFCMALFDEEVPMSHYLLVFVDLDTSTKVYKVAKPNINFGLANKSWCAGIIKALIQSRFQMSSSGELTFFIRSFSQADQGRHLHISGQDNVHLYRSMIGDSQRPSHLNAVQEDLQDIHNMLVGHFLVKDLSPGNARNRHSIRTSQPKAEYVAACTLLGQVCGSKTQLYYFGKDDAGSTWTWKRTCQLSLANWMQIGYGSQQLNATIDSIEYTITEESVRRQLQLADASGINMLQNEEIFAGLQNIGSKSGGWDQFG
ncbi:putative ribonuclease H-like domain-containing protein [Tanacetum coccineum]|uniref:Ribonuclease H-like domain-containing protein n=1 Tax=Tanacetum coccineum TaxID=301880 RepID=A0ABQ5BTB8_9ASTR